ncbi:MAG TPA: sensor domain-containing diguanylate cyclase [Rhodopila sp.]|nr:sensor domain-containing diguanylate cyclase [Rhodopila sp.]
MRQSGQTLAPEPDSGQDAGVSVRPRIERYDRVRGRLADAVLAYLPLAIAVIDHKLRLLYWNAQAAALWGLPPLMAAERPGLAEAVAGLTMLTAGQRSRLIDFCADHIPLGDRIEPDSRLRIAVSRDRRLVVQVRGMGRGAWMVTINDSQTEGVAEPRSLEHGGTETWLDALTGLANRRHLLQALQAQPGDAGSALLLIDMDGLQGINDLYGRATGDALLCLIARRLAREVRDGDLLARPGSDAFVVLTAQADAAPGLADRLLHVLSQPFLVEGQLIEAHFAIGIAPWRGSADLAMDEAVEALRSAKSDASCRRFVFTPQPVPPGGADVPASEIKPAAA